MSEEHVSVEVTIKKVTERAVMAEVEDLDDDLWIPRSVVDWEESDVEAKVGSSGTMMVRAWFAQKEGMR